MTHFRLQRAVRSRMTFRGRTIRSDRLCHPISGGAAPDEDREERRECPPGGLVRLRGAENVEELLVFGRARAKVAREAGEERVQEAASARELGVDAEEPAREGEKSVAGRRFVRTLALEPRRVDVLAAPENPARVRIGADAIRQDRKVPVGELPRVFVVAETGRPRVLVEDEASARRELVADRTEERFEVRQVMQNVVGQNE